MHFTLSCSSAVRVCYCFVVCVHLQPYGDVLKIITFHKNGIFKALVQLSSVDAAVNARLMLEGKDIFQGRDDTPHAREGGRIGGSRGAAIRGRRVWRLTVARDDVTLCPGCCHLRIGFSSLHELHVKAPGNNARDFTSPSGATQPFGAEGGAGGYGNAAAGYQQQSGLINSSSSSGYGGAGGYSDQYHSSSSQQAPPQSGPHAVAPPHPSAPGCVVLVSNLPDVRVSCDVLFTLFGVYGDVQRVKILYNKVSLGLKGLSLVHRTRTAHALITAFPVPVVFCLYLCMCLCSATLL